MAADSTPAPDSIGRVEEVLGIRFADRDLLLAALTHRSFINENPEVAIGDNERLEFLGDAVLDLAVSRLLWDRFPQAREGELSRRRAAIVNEAALAQVAATAGIGEALRLGRGEELTGGRTKASLLADAFEATLAAIFLDAGIEVALRVVERLFGDWIQGAAATPEDHKTRLQELVQARFGCVPRYVTLRESGPDHDKVFLVEIQLGDEALGVGEGRSKKSAEQAAARAALERLAGGATEERR